MYVRCDCGLGASLMISNYFPISVGLMTAQIRSLQEVMEKYPRQSAAKVHLKELIDKRKRFLRYLRRWDYRRFEYILEKLDLVYKPYPT